MLQGKKNIDQEESTGSCLTSGGYIHAVKEDG